MNNSAVKFVCEKESATSQEDSQYDPLGWRIMRAIQLVIENTIKTAGQCPLAVTIACQRIHGIVGSMALSADNKRPSMK